MDSETAFFSAVRPSVAKTHPRMTEFTAYAPEANRKQEMYRAATFIVAQEMTKPISAAPMQTVIYQFLSFVFPDVQPMTIPKRPETRYGGHVSAKVMVRSKPRLFDNGREEVVEAASREMHILHEANQVEAWIADSLVEAGACALRWLESECIANDSSMSHLSLPWSQPLVNE